MLANLKCPGLQKEEEEMNARDDGHTDSSSD